MNGKSKKTYDSGWNYREDPGLDLYCGIEGVDRCLVGRCQTTAIPEVKKTYPVLQPKFKHAVNRGLGLAAVWMILIRPFIRR
jgi:hypothetical protein